MRFILIMLWICLFVASSFEINGQDPLRFESEVQELVKKYKAIDEEEIVVFTGSSSVRFWNSLNQDFPDHNIVNTGFGGSHFSDLLYFQDSLIHKFSPKRLFVYEGDNDISFGKDASIILKEAGMLIQNVQSLNPDCLIYFISPKPSIARWNKKKEYVSFNRQLKELCEQKTGVFFIDVWSPMCSEDGEVITDLFIADRLHMNEKGYKIWKAAIGPYLITP